jgi:clan AA aspartic protease
MITGDVRADEVRVRIRVRGRRGRETEVEAVVDTGYNGTLTLPPTLISDLGLRWDSYAEATLADGSTCSVQVFVGHVVWNGRARQIGVDAADTTPLIGMRLLRGHELNVQVRYRGQVTIRPLPRRRA